MKKLVSCILAMAISMVSAVSVFADDVIAPTNVVENSEIGNLFIRNIVKSFCIGNDIESPDTIIIPENIIENTQADRMDIINNIIAVNVNVDEKMISDFLNGIGGWINNMMNTVFN